MFIDNFEHICEIKGLKPTPVLNECGISPATASNWVKKRTVVPDGKTIVKLSEHLGVSTDYLLLGKEASLTPEEQQLIIDFSSLNQANKIRVLERIEALLESQTLDSKPETQTIQITHYIEKVSAGLGFDLSDYAPQEMIEVPLNEVSRKADFCLTVKGDSMEPKFSDGDIVFVREQPAVDIGQICIYVIEGQGFIKKYGKDRLISLNDKYDDILFSKYDADSIWCKGLVIGRV